MSDGLSAVYKFETRIKEDDNQDTAQLYAGLSGGFGTVSLGELPAAANNHVGFVDNSALLGGNASLLETFTGDTVSYASPSIGGFSFQVDAQGDRSGAQDKDVDSAQFGATMQLGESGKVGIGYIDRATKGKDNPTAKKDPGHYKDGALCPSPNDDGCEYSAGNAADAEAHLDDDRTAMIAGHYSIGGLGLHLGYGQRKWDTDSKTGVWDEEKDDYAKGLIGEDLLDKKQKTTFFGLAGGIGDTGVGFFLQVESTKTNSNKVTSSRKDDYDAFKGVEGKYEFNKTGYQVTVVTAGTTPTDTAATRRAAAKAALDAAGIRYRQPTLTTNTFTLLPAGAEWNSATVTEIGWNDAEGRSTTTVAEVAIDTDSDDYKRGSAKSSEKNTPFVLGLSRSLGGGASIHLEHANTDNDASHNQTALILKVDF